MVALPALAKRLRSASWNQCSNSRDYCQAGINSGREELLLIRAVSEKSLAQPNSDERELIPTELPRLVLLQARSAPQPGFFLCYPAKRRMPLALRTFIDHVGV